MRAEKTWTISDLDGSNRRVVTLAQYRAEVEAAKARAVAIFMATVQAQAKAEGQ